MDKQDDITSAIAGSDAGQLLRLIGLDEATSTGWALADAASIFHHQMNAPLDFDLSGEALLGATTVSALRELPSAGKIGITTFGKLFLHREPPIELLQLCKGFFKRIAGMHPKDSADHQVAYMCYLFSVIVARLRYDKRITNLGDSELLNGLDWALKQTWLDKSIRKVLMDARPVFGKN